MRVLEMSTFRSTRSRSHCLVDTGAVVGNSSFISPAPAVTSEVPSTLFPAGPTPLPKSSRQSGKRKAETDSREGAFRTPVLSPVECINIGSRWDELDPIVLEKLPASAAITAASIHKYWTSAFEKAADRVVEAGRNDLDALRSENKDLRKHLAFFEDARARAIYDITKSKTIRKACVQAHKKAESQLRSCQNMVHAKDKELTEVLNELSRAQDLLAKLRVLGYADPKSPTGT
ncbi:Uncharacterized protein Fot_38082 [Forsythia ovata]|uniref:Uncharacterized protein n=1 Tax=Forsythia ovata TaxID=205694 RepID=A0ABD1S0V6_9LAMI